MAELVSAYPTAGGMYFVTKHVVPPKYVAFWAWIVGWCNFLGQTAGVTSVAFTVSQMMLAAASMNSSFQDGNYSYVPYFILAWIFWGSWLTLSRNALQTVLLAILLLFIMGVICSLTSRVLHRIIIWFAPINSNFWRARIIRILPDLMKVLASVAICIALLVLTPEKQSAKWVFTTVTDGSGWGNKGFSFLLGYLTLPYLSYG